MALVADSFHMLSDIISLGVGYFALKFSKKRNTDVPKSGNTFGWVRAGVLGALVNAVFLVALCLSIFISALKRFITTEKLNRPLLILVVGCLGLLVNILGIFLFHGHAHSHGCGHGHSHGGGSEGSDGHGHNHENRRKSSHKISNGHSHSDIHNGYKKGETPLAIKNGSAIHQKDVSIFIENNECEKTKKLPIPHHVTSQCPPDSPSLRRFQARARDVETLFVPPTDTQIEIPVDTEVEEDDSDKSEGHLNTKGVYLHILGDALGSIIVIIAALIVHFVKNQSWTDYIDPALSLILVLIILNSSVPLLKESSMILLQNVPPHIEIKQLEEKLLKSFPEIISVHEFHVWQLAGTKIIASVHVKFVSKADYKRVSSHMKEFFHCEGIHSTTFQPEYEEDGDGADVKTTCLLSCVSKSCKEKVCCLPPPDEKDCHVTANGHQNGHAVEIGSQDEENGDKGANENSQENNGFSIDDEKINA